MYIFKEHTKIRRKKKIYFPLLSHIFSAPKHQAPSKVAKKKKKKKKERRRSIEVEREKERERERERIAKNMVSRVIKQTQNDVVLV